MVITKYVEVQVVDCIFGDRYVGELLENGELLSRDERRLDLKIMGSMFE
jgi:hypothetical protein